MNNYNEDRRWIERLRELPNYRPFVDKLVLEMPTDAGTNRLMQETDRRSLSGLGRFTVRLYLIRLKLRLEANSPESTETDDTEQSQRFTQPVDEFSSGTAPKVDVEAKQSEPIEVNKATEAQRPSSIIDEMTSDGLVQFVAKMHLAHIKR